MSAPPTYAEGLFDAEDAVIDEWQACAAGHHAGHHAALDSEDLAWHIRVYGDHRYAAALDAAIAAIKNYDDSRGGNTDTEPLIAAIEALKGKP